MADIFPAFMAPRIWGRWSHTHRYFTTELHHHNLSRGNSARKKSGQKITDGRLEGWNWFDKFLIFSYFPIFCSSDSSPIIENIHPRDFYCKPTFDSIITVPDLFTLHVDSGRASIEFSHKLLQRATAPLTPEIIRFLSRDANDLFSNVEKVWQRILAGKGHGTRQA